MLAGLIALLLLNLIYSSLARRYDLNELGKMPERSVVFDAAGGELGRLHGENRTVIPLSQVAPSFSEALLAREDDRFYSHGGVDYMGVLRALFRAVKDRDISQGASTITMQLARNSFDLTREKSLHRKLLEIAIARRIEANRTKDQILELYVNRIFFGSGISGIERAARSYFGKPAKDLTMDESAMLAAIIRGPNVFSPFRHYDKAMSGRDMVLDRMVDAGRISATEAERVKKVKTKVLGEPKTPPDSWALDAVRRELARLLDEGEVEEGGLRIFTTLDPVLQRVAEAELERRITEIERLKGYAHQTRAAYGKLAAAGNAPAPEYLQGAVVVLENSTGAIKSIVGGRDIRDSSFNRAILAKRQVGSTFKPIVYAAAVEQAGLLPSTLVDDGPLRPEEIRTAEGAFNPKNSDESYAGPQTAWWGLAKSRNTMAVRVGEIAGLDDVKALAEAADLGVIEGRSAQIYLGNLGATLESLTSAYSMFPNQGNRCRPYLIDRIEDTSGEVVFRSGVVDHNVISPGSAWLMTAMLARVMEPGGTGAGVRNAGYKGPAAGKTGTTDDYHDAWFVGFSPRHTCGVWVGLDDPERIIHQGYGSRLALPVWAGVMKAAEGVAGESPGEWPPPENPVRVTVCQVSGKLATAACGKAGVTVDLPEANAPLEKCSYHGGAQGVEAPREPVRSRAEPPSFFRRIGDIFR